MKVWMWQRLFKFCGDGTVRAMMNPFESALVFSQIPHNKMCWLCPKPNLVLVNRKHLGGME
jgi:hypothetical protein